MSTTIDLNPEVPGGGDTSGVSRRGFLGGTGLAAAGLAAGTVAFEQLLDAQPAEAVNTQTPAYLLQRRDRAAQIRKQAADFWKGLNTPPVPHPNNGDEDLYPNRIGSYSKGLPHNQYGEVVPAAYHSFLAAIASGNPAAYNAIQISPGGRKLTNPQAGLAFEVEGADSHAVPVPPAPTLASKEEAGEMVELYWMALLRDTNFLDYGSSPAATAAIADLNGFGNAFKGPKVNGQVTLQTLFRDIAPGTTAGPYISQFMWLNTPFGVERIDRQMWTKAPGDHMQSFADWLAVQNGYVNESPNYLGQRRYIINGRDLAEWVHIDVLFQAYFNACLILGTPPDGSDTGGGIGCPLNPTNPYVGNPTQDPFVTFGPPGIKALLCEVATRGLKATWHKKWQVHRRLRPETFGGRVEVQLNQDPGRYNGIFHPSLFNASVLNEVASHNGGTFLLPMAFPEGSPTHPAYTAGHATVAGACVTILKAFFDTENFTIPHPKVPTADGSALVDYTGRALTVEGELNKLASNVATGRDIAGVHWRTDSFWSLRLGQAIAISVLLDHKRLFNENGVSFNFRGFDGERIIL
jgi:hypothetical protein